MKFESSRVSVEETKRQVFSPAPTGWKLRTVEDKGPEVQHGEAVLPLGRRDALLSVSEHLLRHRPFVRPQCFGKRSLPDQRSSGFVCASQQWPATAKYNRTKILIEGCCWSLNLPSLPVFMIEVFRLDGKFLGHSCAQ